MDNLETLFNTVKDCEPNEDDLNAIQFLLDKEYADGIEAVTLAYMFGKNSK